MLDFNSSESEEDSIINAICVPVVKSVSFLKEISELLFFDSIEIEQNKKKVGGRSLLYDKEDVRKTMMLWSGIPYHEAINLSKNLCASFKNAGHILGSAMIEIVRTIKAGEAEKRIVFTGDLGNSPDPILPDTEIVNDADYLVIESVYGDRNHEDRGFRKERLEDAVERTVQMRGVLLIPAFSIERTQELLFEIGEMMRASKIPLVLTFLDSPLSIKAVDIYKKYSDYLNQGVKKQSEKGRLFASPQLMLIKTSDESKNIDKFPNPKIIIAGSGMSDAGRIIFHEKKYLEDPRTTLLFVGYQIPGSLGRKLHDGVKEITISDKKISVRARIESISGYSAHKDRDGLMQFVENSADRLKQVFVVMGEPKSSMFLIQRIRDYLGLNAYMPKEGEIIELDF